MSAQSGKVFYPPDGNEEAQRAIASQIFSALQGLPGMGDLDTERVHSYLRKKAKRLPPDEFTNPERFAIDSLVRRGNLVFRPAPAGKEESPTRPSGSPGTPTTPASRDIPPRSPATYRLEGPEDMPEELPPLDAPVDSPAAPFDDSSSEDDSIEDSDRDEEADDEVDDESEENEENEEGESEEDSEDDPEDEEGEENEESPTGESTGTDTGPSPSHEDVPAPAATDSSSGPFGTSVPSEPLVGTPSPAPSGEGSSGDAMDTWLASLSPPPLPVLPEPVEAPPVPPVSPPASPSSPSPTPSGDPYRERLDSLDSIVRDISLRLRENARPPPPAPVPVVHVHVTRPPKPDRERGSPRDRAREVGERRAVRPAPSPPPRPVEVRVLPAPAPEAPPRSPASPFLTRVWMGLFGVALLVIGAGAVDGAFGVRPAAFPVAIGAMGFLLVAIVPLGAAVWLLGADLVLQYRRP